MQFSNVNRVTAVSFLFRCMWPKLA